MKKNLLSDRPVSKKDEDRFQRFDFSRRIAETIVESQNSDSIVIGIYGVWGEGKTSVINFIESELKKPENENIIPIRFNPWRFTDEAVLLVSFFNTLASEVKKSVPPPHSNENKSQSFIKKKKKGFDNWWSSKKEPLKTNKETIGEIIEKYGKIVSIFGAGEAAETIGKAISNVDIETLKDRFEKLLVESGRKIVILIDDIDRLDKQEIHSIFRLIKLNADFSNTVYILSFDQEMVASAIGEHFGEGDQDAGYNFLEKIIQVPLKIPVAQPAALKKYCFELVDKAMNESNLELAEKEVKRFVSEFSENILLKLKTPRLAVRYGNTLSFSLPLLKGEVNHVDLMLIEAIKIFYPEHYEFIKKHPHYFITSYSTSYSFGNSRDIETKKNELSDHLENLGQKLTKREKSSIKALLIELFPRLNEAFHNTFQHNGDTIWFKEKRIVSPEYFNRFFSYAVIEGELSDVSFESFIQGISKNENDKIIIELKKLISKSSIDNFLHKIRSFENDFDWNTSIKLTTAISQIVSDFPDNKSAFGFVVNNPREQAAIFIYQLLKKHSNKDESFELAKELMKKAEPFEFAYKINNWLRTGETNDDKIFSYDNYVELARVLRERALDESKGIPLFEKFPNIVGYLFSTWKEADEESFDKYIKDILSVNAVKITDLLRAFTPTMTSSNYPEPYKSNFTKDQFNYLKSLFDKDYIHKLIIEQYSEELSKDKVKFPDFENTQTNINILRQFEHWYEKEIKELEKQIDNK